MENNSWEDFDNQEKWDEPLSRHLFGNFLQSFEFGEFHKKVGNRVWRLGLKTNGLANSFFQIIELKTRFGKLFYVPGGPLLADWGRDIEGLVKKLQQLAIEENVSFIRLDPRIIDEKQQALLTDLGFRQAPVYTQPQASLLLDLTKSLEELRSNLSDSTRYNVGWVERKGVRVKISEDESDIALFNKLLTETASRHNFNLYRNKDYYKEQYLAFNDSNKAKLFLTYEPSELGSDCLAAAVVIYFGDTATYLHAASSSKNPKLRAPYLMQWKIIEDAKNTGYKKYDFWGVAKDNNPKDPWAGVTEFKRSFGGEKIYYQKPYDLLIKKSYYLESLLERTRVFSRKLRFQ